MSDEASAPGDAGGAPEHDDQLTFLCVVDRTEEMSRSRRQGCRPRRASGTATSRHHRVRSSRGPLRQAVATAAEAMAVVATVAEVTEEVMVAVVTEEASEVAVRAVATAVVVSAAV